MQVTVRYAVSVEEPVAAATVLVMSEDSAWRTDAGRVLEREGYRVLAARHAGHALVTCVRHAGPVDLVVADGTVLSGSGLAPLIREQPGLRPLVFDRRSGTSDDLLAAVRDALLRA